jgi:hypothetical protein
MFAILATKSLQTSVLAGLLFYVFANPGMYKIIRQFPGLKFVMKSATEITHQGTMVNALLFGIVLFLCVYLINSALIKDHLKFLNVVENYEDSEGVKDSEGLHSCVEGIWSGGDGTKGYPCDVALDGANIQCMDGTGRCTPLRKGGGPSWAWKCAEPEFLLKNYQKCGCTKMAGNEELYLYCHDLPAK